MIEHTGNEHRHDSRHTADEEQGFRALLAYLRDTRGFDFTGYKSAGLRRRVLRRMRAADEGMNSFGEYLDYLEVHPEEFAELFNAILINVTSFFRDHRAWEYLAQEIVPQILANVDGDTAIRCWSAGCASGEETYTLAMVLAEAMGESAYQRRVKIYATDVDESELTRARLAVYTAHDLESVPPELRKKYFAPAQGGFQFSQDLRRNIIFGRHDLVQDAPISRLDLLVCRNTLMYFHAESQGRILSRFRFALKDSGFLFLGRAEMLLTHADLFEPVNLKHRVFVRARRRSDREQLLELGRGAGYEPDVPGRWAQQSRLREAALDAIADAILVVDVNANLVAANRRARELFGLRADDLGHPLRDLGVANRPLELRGPIAQAMSGHGVVTIPNVECCHPASGETLYLEVRVVPANGGDGALLGAAVVMSDVTRYRTLELELQRTNLSLEAANEELQSTVEELETTNEEFQSANEELETVNEELHSTNEELEALNGELRRRTIESDEASAFYESILASLNGGLVVVDDDLDVLVWNPGAEDLWGLRADEVIGRPLLGLNIGLSMDELCEPLRRFVDEEQAREELTRRATNRLGRSIEVQLTFTSLGGGGGRRRGVVILMVERES